MRKFVKKLFYRFVPAALQLPLKRFISFVWVWVPIFQIDRSGLTVIMIGCESCDPYFIRLLYGEYLEGVRIGSVPSGSLGWVIRRWEAKADLIIFRDRRVQPRGSVARRMLVMPYFVRQCVKLPPPDANLLATFKNSSTQNDLRKIHTGEFQYEITQDPAQLEFFYHHMYRPFILARHGDSGVIYPWENFKRSYDKMEILLIRQAGQLVAGSLNRQTDNCYNLHLLGILNADREVIKRGGISAVWWFSLTEAFQRGCATLNMECARPFLRDGVLVYKKKWGGRIVMDHREPEFWLLPCHDRGRMSRFLEENPLICAQDGWLVSLIFLGAQTVLNDKELSTYLRACHFQGDRLSTWVMLLNDQWAARIATIQSILQTLPPPNHILDLSHSSLTELPEQIRNGHRAASPAVHAKHDQPTATLG
jgi:hypothetical protein